MSNNNIYIFEKLFQQKLEIYNTLVDGKGNSFRHTRDLSHFMDETFREIREWMRVQKIRYKIPYLIYKSTCKKPMPIKSFMNIINNGKEKYSIDTRQQVCSAFMDNGIKMKWYTYMPKWIEERMYERQQSIEKWSGKI